VGPWVNLDSLGKSTTAVSTDPLLNQYGTREQQIKGGTQRHKANYNNLKLSGGSMSYDLSFKRCAICSPVLKRIVSSLYSENE